MKLLFEHLVEIEKKLDAITYGPSSNIAAEAAKSFTGHQEERQILKEKESVKDAEK
jgi:hypothetical protein